MKTKSLRAAMLLPCAMLLARDGGQRFVTVELARA